MQTEITLKSEPKGKIFWTGVICTVLSFGGGFWLHHILSRRKRRTALRYMFVDNHGKTFSITEEQMLKIKQQYADNVLISEIAKQHNLDILQLCRVLSYIQGIL